MKNYTKKLIIIIPIILFFIIYMCILVVCIIKSTSYKPIKSDVIIVLGYSIDDNQNPSEYLEKRLETALSLYNDGFAKNIIVSGGVGPTDTIPVAVSMKKWFLNKGVPSELIFTEMYANSTYENFVYSKEICNENNFKNPIIVTNDFHMYRSMLMSKEFFDNSSGLEAKVPISIEKFFMYLKEPLSIFKYEIFNKNTSDKVLEKNKNHDLSPINSIDTLEKYNDVFKKNDITSYDIQMNYDSITNTFKNMQTVTFYNTYNKPIDTIKMNLYHNRLKTVTNSDDDYITIDNIMCNDRELFYTNNSDSIDIQIDSLKPLEKITFDIYFTATIPKIDYLTGSNDDIIWAKDFFPVIAQFEDGEFIQNKYVIDNCYNDMSKYKISVYTNSDYTVILPNTTTSTVQNEIEITKMEETLLRNMSFAISKNVKKVSTDTNDSTYISLYVKEANNNTYNILQTALSTVNYIESNIATYPYDEIKIVEVSQKEPTVSYGSGMIFVDKNYTQNPNFERELLNAVVSQWFGDLVATNIEDTYISTGISRVVSDATFRKALTLDSYIDSEVSLYRENVEYIKNSNLDNTNFYFTNYENYYFNKHIKAKLMMYDIKNTLDDKWLNFLKTYFKIYSFSVVDSQDFKILASEYAHKNIKEMFDDWVNTDDFLNIEGGTH